MSCMVGSLSTIFTEATTVGAPGEPGFGVGEALADVEADEPGLIGLESPWMLFLAAAARLPSMPPTIAPAASAQSRMANAAMTHFRLEVFERGTGAAALSVPTCSG